MQKDIAQIRRIFIDFFAERGHQVVPSASLIPVDPSLLLTAAGMVQFKPYMLGDEQPPYRQACSVQKCARTSDIDIVGTTARHLTFFEMLGNFSFGDYFKEKAIPYAWELVTEGFGFDPDRLWVTVHESDYEAFGIWSDVVGFPEKRIQRGQADNFWTMGAAGPCGPSSEIFFDKGMAYGDEGGPMVDDERFVEIWNLVFMQYIQDADGNVIDDLPQRNIDTGAGLERLAVALNELSSVFDVETIRPVLEVGERAARVRYGDDDRTDTALRILADHGRAATFLVTDGVFPSNEGRGYVLRRILRRAVRDAWILGIDDDIMVPLADVVIETMGEAYPELVGAADATRDILSNEEGRFRQTLKAGINQLDTAIEEASAGVEVGTAPVLTGDVAFKLHDTFGFPIELTAEIASERNVDVDQEGFRTEMEAQKDRARAARKDTETPGGTDLFRSIGTELADTLFLGYETTQAAGQILALVCDDERVDAVEVEAESTVRVDVFADQTPFYAEQGGQVGDTGVITTETGTLEVIDTRYAMPGVIVHKAVLTQGRIASGQEADFAVDTARRDGIRKHHTATHILHWALREVLGDHVRQQGSLVEPDRLRFDFSHFAPMTSEQIDAVEALANREVLTNASVKTLEMSKEQADEQGVIAFFGEKYGEHVRVLEAGHHSRELCGGTHVSALGEIGPIVIVTESSIGSNLRRIEAFAGNQALTYFQGRRRLFGRNLRSAPSQSGPSR